jgi:hypothetical protein
VSEQPTLPIARAIEQFDVSASTLRRSIQSQKLPNAYKNGKGRWAIPVDNLVNAGFATRSTGLNDRTPKPDREPVQDIHPLSDLGHPRVAPDPAHPAGQRAHERAHRLEPITQVDTSEGHGESGEGNTADLHGDHLQRWVYQASSITGFGIQHRWHRFQGRLAQPRPVESQRRERTVGGDVARLLTAMVITSCLIAVLILAVWGAIAVIYGPIVTETLHAIGLLP